MRWLSFILFLFACASECAAEENFVLINGASNQIIMELGPHVDEQIAPNSTFKIALSLMGFDSGILQDEHNPEWQFEEGYDDFLESWKSPKTPLTWMKTSCVWFSVVLAAKLGKEAFENYLSILDYGNRDTKDGIDPVWINSTIKISPREQVAFLKKLIQGEHAISNHALEKTKNILFIEELSGGWKLFGKTGWTGSKKDGTNEIGWFVGWIEKEDQFYPFAYNIREQKINLSQRVPRVKELLLEAKL